jgi:AcrR family transcriptional regulator
MPASTARRRPAQQRSRLTVEAIVEAAAQVFERHGYAAGTTNRIAERAGVSVGTLYQYFADKDAVLAAVFERHLAEGAAIVAPTLARLREVPAPEPERLLREVLDAMVVLHAREPNLHRLLFEEAPLAPGLRDKVTAMEAAIAGEAAAWLRRRGTAGDADTVAWVIVQAVEALAHRWVIQPGPRGDDDAFVRDAARVLSAGL